MKLDKPIWDLDRASVVLKLLGDRTRLTIMKILEYRECCVCELVEIFQVSQPSISQHLRKLRDAGLVQEEKRGQWTYYALNEESNDFPMVQTILKQLLDQGTKLKAVQQKGDLHCSS